MKIEVDLTSFHEWDNERVIRVMAGIEIAAYKYPGEPWMVKTVRCNWCGKCCMNLGDKQAFPITTTDGVCDHLQKEPGGGGTWRCVLAINRPYGCSVANPSHHDYCCVEYEAVE